MNKNIMPRKQTQPIEQAVDQQALTQALDNLTVNEKPKRTRKVKQVEVPPPSTLPVVAEKKKREPSKWVQALRKYNEGKSGYIIPKKDTPEYEAVRALMG